jgi:hypothetical protein
MKGGKTQAGGSPGLNFYLVGISEQLLMKLLFDKRGYNPYHAKTDTGKELFSFIIVKYVFDDLRSRRTP